MSEGNIMYINMKKNTIVLICLEQAFHGYTSKINDL